MCKICLTSKFEGVTSFSCHTEARVKGEIFSMLFLELYLINFVNLVQIFSDILELNNDYSNILDFRRGKVGEVGWSRFYFVGPWLQIRQC